MQETWTYPDTTGWAEFPFEIGKFNFVSKLDKQGDLYRQVMEKFGAQTFKMLNVQFIHTQMEQSNAYDLSAISDILSRINEFAHEAVIELA